MCTVTVIPLASGRRGYRLVTSRDELRTRPQGEPPQWHSLRDGKAVWPTDSLAGGTWVAASDRGLTLAILNMTAPHLKAPPTHKARTRGEIIPKLIHHRDCGAAVAGLGERSLDCYAPFRLVAVCSRMDGLPRILEARWDGDRLATVEHRDTWGCFASSGLGDELVADRIGLFEAMVRPAADPVSAQDEFHYHRWDGRPEASVLMCRGDARTVSITTIAVRRAEPPLSAVDAPFEVKPFYMPLPEEPPVVEVRARDREAGRATGRR